MSSIFNRVSLVGRLTGDPRFANNEKGTAYFITLAVERPYKNQDGSRPVDFIEARYFQKVGSNSRLMDYMKKGVMVGITGEMRSYTDEKNYTHQVIQIDPNGVAFMPTNTRHSSDAQTQAKPAPKKAEPANSTQSAKPSNVPADAVELTENDLPF